MLKNIFFFFGLTSLLSIIPTNAQIAHLKPVQLTTEFRTNPVGIGTIAPKFAWTLQSTVPGERSLRQSAYRILLSTSTAELQRHSGNVWDSGRVISSTYWQRSYDGPSLQSHATYYWQVQVWSTDSSRGSWSGVSQFTTALLSESDWTAHWIAAVPDHATNVTASEHGVMASDPPALPIFRHGFTVTKPVASAALFVAGLGQYEVHLNGRDVTANVLNSGWTDYRKTVLYDTYDVKKLIHPGPNAFGVLLGNGMYNVEGVQGHYTKFSSSFGQPKCLLQLEVRYTDGSSERFLSDGSWQARPGPVLYSSTYGGEVFDARALSSGWDGTGHASDGWRPALEVAGPGGKLTAATSAPMIVAETLRAVGTTHPKAGVTVYDLGKTISGWPSLEVSGAAGSSVEVLAGELLNPDGTVSQKSANAFPNDPVIYRYVLRGGSAEHWHARFAYYSFRYVQVTPLPAPAKGTLPNVLSLGGDFVHADAPVVGHFESSNELFQRIHVLIDRAVLSNLASVVTDCPSREKLGWLEQTYLNAATLMLNYNVTGLYEKMSDDMKDAQLADGLVPSIAPEYVAFVDANGKSNAFRDSPEWGSAMVLSPWALYQFTGDLRPLTTSYAAMQRYVSYLQSRAADGLLDYGLGDWYDIGPKAPGPSQLTSRFVTATGIYFEDLTTMVRIATLLGHADDAERYKRQAAEVREAFNAKLFHPDTDQYDRGSQTANALPLALGLVQPEHVAGVLANLVADIHAHGNHVTAGDIGFHYVVRALIDHARSDVLAAMFSRTDSPSYGYQLARGATTLTEAWDANPDSSQNHFMLGHGEEWFYRGLAGLSIDMARGPDDAIRLQPSFLAGVAHASGSFQTPMGLVQIGWKRNRRSAVVDVSVPAGTFAHLKLPPANDWREGHVAASHSSGVSRSPENDNGLELTLASGLYHFSTASFQDQPTPME